MRFKQFLFFLGMVLIPISIGIYSPQAVQTSRAFAHVVFQPLLESAHWLNSWVIAQTKFANEIVQLHRENKRLSEKTYYLEHELLTFKEMKQENLRLKKLLEFKQTGEAKTISAQVIARDLSHWNYYVVINKGSRDGVKMDMPVVTGEGLVGKVVGLTLYSARVILLIDPESRVSALVQETRDVGLVEGVGQPALRMTYLDLRAGVQIGQTVISSGFGGIYPKGIPIGQIVQIGEEKGQMSLYAIIQPFVAFSKLEEVLCVQVDEQRPGGKGVSSNAQKDTQKN